MRRAHMHAFAGPAIRLHGGVFGCAGDVAVIGFDSLFTAAVVEPIDRCEVGWALTVHRNGNAKRIALEAPRRFAFGCRDIERLQRIAFEFFRRIEVAVRPAGVNPRNGLP